MDLQLYVRVLWRFRLLVLVGLTLALTLAFFSYVRLQLDGISPSFAYRESQVWQSEGTLLVTQRGFPWGRSVDEYVRAGSSEDAPLVPRFADPSRFSNLAILYSQLATSDAVEAIALRDGPLPGTLGASALLNTEDAPLPLIKITGVATSSEGAVSTARRGIDAFQEFLRTEQARNNIPSPERVAIEVVQEPEGALLVEPRRKTRAIVIFIAVMVAVVGLAFILENMRPLHPRVRAVSSEKARSRSQVRSRRSSSA